MQDNINKIDKIINKVCLSEISLSRIEGYVDLLNDLLQETNDNKIHALLYSLEQESKSQVENLSDIEGALLHYKNDLDKDNKDS